MGNYRTVEINKYPGKQNAEYDATHAGGFIHVDPGSIDVDTGVRIVEHFKFIGPVAKKNSQIQTGKKKHCADSRLNF